MKNKFRIVIAVIAFFFSVNLVIASIGALEETRGSISIYLESGGKNTNVNEVEFKLVKVANLVNGEYFIDNQLRELNLNLSSITYANDLQKNANIISNYVVRNNIAGELKKTNSYGYLKFCNLSNGIYLLHPVDINEYDNIYPSLIAVPSIDNNEVNGMNYEIKIIPKHSPIIAEKTGDDNKFNILLILGVGSIVLGVFMYFKRSKR